MNSGVSQLQSGEVSKAACMQVLIEKVQEFMHPYDLEKIISKPNW